LAPPPPFASTYEEIPMGTADLTSGLSNALLRDLLQEAQHQGFRLKLSGSGHINIFTRGGGFVTWASTSVQDSGPASQKVLTSLRRNGFVWPPPRRRHPEEPKVITDDIPISARILEAMADGNPITPQALAIAIKGPQQTPEAVEAALAGMRGQGKVMRDADGRWRLPAGAPVVASAEAAHTPYATPTLKIEQVYAALRDAGQPLTAQDIAQRSGTGASGEAMCSHLASLGRFVRVGKETSPRGAKQGRTLYALPEWGQPGIEVSVAGVVLPQVPAAAMPAKPPEIQRPAWVDKRDDGERVADHVREQHLLKARNPKLHQAERILAALAHTGVPMAYTEIAALMGATPQAASICVACSTLLNQGRVRVAREQGPDKTKGGKLPRLYALTQASTAPPPAPHQRGEVVDVVMRYLRAVRRPVTVRDVATALVMPTSQAAATLVRLTALGRVMASGQPKRPHRMYRLVDQAAPVPATPPTAPPAPPAAPPAPVRPPKPALADVPPLPALPSHLEATLPPAQAPPAPPPAAEGRDRYLALLLAAAEKQADPGVLDRIERLLGL